jgi:hypothetical protein
VADKKVKTMELSGNPYAKVAERLKQFREEWKNGKIETEHKYLEDGSIEFKAWIWKDKKDYLDMLASVMDTKIARGSADADGSSKGKNKDEDKKGFEKLQTIAVGRALANLGYLASGDIASFEEMEEYDEYKQHQVEQAVRSAIESLAEAKTMEELKIAFVETRMMNNSDVIAAGAARKLEIEKAEGAS